MDRNKILHLPNAALMEAVLVLHADEAETFALVCRRFYNVFTVQEEKLRSAVSLNVSGSGQSNKGYLFI